MCKSDQKTQIRRVEEEESSDSEEMETEQSDSESDNSFIGSEYISRIFWWQFFKSTENGRQNKEEEQNIQSETAKLHRTETSDRKAYGS